MGGGLESHCVGRVCGADGAVPKTCRVKNTLIKLPCCIKLAVQIISRGRYTVKQPPKRTGKGMQSNTTLSIKMFNDYIR